MTSTALRPEVTVPGGRPNGARPLALLAALLTAVVAVPGLSRPLWRDEVASYDIASRSLGGLLRVLGSTDASMGLYYLLLHPLARVGDAPFWLRLPSVLATAAAVGLTVLLVHRVAGTLAARCSVPLLVLSLPLLEYAQQARPYALATALVVLASLLLLREVAAPTRRGLVAYAVVLALAGYAHLFLALALLAHVPVVLLHARAQLLRLAWAWLAAAAAVAPLLLLVRAQAEQVGWIDRPPASAWVTPVVFTAGGGGVAVALLIVGAAALWLARRSRPGPGLVLLGFWAVLPPVVLLTVSWLGPAVYTPRYVLSAVPAVLALGVLALARLPARAAVVATTAVGLLSLPGVSAQWRSGYHLEDLQAAARHLTERSRPADGLVYVPDWGRPGFAHHLARVAHPERAPRDLTVLRSAREVGHLYAEQVPPEQVRARLLSVERLWVVAYDVEPEWQPTPPTVQTAAPAVLREDFRQTSDAAFGQVHVRGYIRTR